MIPERVAPTLRDGSESGNGEQHWNERTRERGERGTRSSRKTYHRDMCSETFLARFPRALLSLPCFICVSKHRASAADAVVLAESPRKTCGSCSPGAHSSWSETARRPLAAPCCPKRGSGSIDEAHKSPGPSARRQSHGHPSIAKTEAHVHELRARAVRLHLAARRIERSETVPRCYTRRFPTQGLAGRSVGLLARI